MVESSFVVDAKNEEDAVRIAPKAFAECVEEDIKNFGEPTAFIAWLEGE